MKFAENLDYDYTESDCAKLTSKNIRENLESKLRLHATSHNCLVEMPWTEEEMCPPIYTKEDAKEIERQREWHAQICDRIEEQLRDLDIINIK